MTTQKNVLRFLTKEEIEKLVDDTAQKVVHYLLNKLAFSQPETKDINEPFGIQVTKEFLEAWVAQACQMKRVGAGSYPIDVYRENEFGVDIKAVSAEVDQDGKFTRGVSGESSLGQNFSDGDINLDTLFANEDKESILNKWLEILKSKYKRPMEDYKLKIFYYFIFIRGGDSMYLSICEVDTQKLKKLTPGEITRTSLFVDNFIEGKYGNVKIYKSKKRMELRLFPKIMQDDNLFISWKIDDFKPTLVDLRKLVESNRLEMHQKSEIKKFFNLDC